MLSSPFRRQLYVAFPSLLAAISSGGAVCYPMVLLQQLKLKDSPIQLDFDTASWMGSIHGIASIPGVLMPYMMQWKGRKIVFIVTGFITAIGWVLSYFATNTTTLLIAESFHGFGTGCLLEVSCLIITEMTSPKNRDGFVQLFYILQTVGMVMQGALTQHCHWKTISIIMLVPNVISLLIAYTLPESPYWLAYKGNFEICKNNFVWLRGSDAASKKELSDLTNAQMATTHSFDLQSARHLWKKITNKEFYIPAIHVTVLQFLIHGSGSIATLIYAIVILGKITNNDTITGYGGLIINLMFCIGLCIAIVLDRFLKKKTILLSSIFWAVVCLVIGSAFSYFQSKEMWPLESLVGLYCLSGFMLSSSVGILGLSYSVGAALICVRNRGLGGALMLLNTGLFHTAALKSAPYMFLHLNMWGTYLVYAAVCISCGLFIWKYIPEIRGRSLQEIENYYMHGSYSYGEDKKFVKMTPLIE